MSSVNVPYGFNSRRSAERALYDPALATEALVRLDAPAGDAGGDAAPSEVPSAAPEVVRLVGVELRRPLARASGLAARTKDGRDGGDHRFEERRVVRVRRRERDAGAGN
jgi:hypothetical protein